MEQADMQIGIIRSKSQPTNSLELENNQIRRNLITKGKNICLKLVFALIPFVGFSQVLLEAKGPGETYELINSVLAPGYDVVENPECVHPEFGRHIAEVWDNELNKYVFEFYIHVVPDNDRCINLDRQRMEIKTYDKSPANLIGTYGETVVYKWNFRLPVGFQPSNNFTHIHQIKAVNGNDDDPIFTLTPRKGIPNKLELIHNNTTKVAKVNLSLFEGNWVEATERIKIDSLQGTYSIEIKKVSDGITILSYTSNDIMTIRSDNSFIRPKWGIYRSLLAPEQLRDEAVRFASFSIEEAAATLVDKDLANGNNRLKVYPNPANEIVNFDFYLSEKSIVNLTVHNLIGQKVKVPINNELKQPGPFHTTFDVTDLVNGFYFIRYSFGRNNEIVKLCIGR